MIRSRPKIGAVLSYVVLALQNIVGLLYTPFMQCSSCFIAELALIALVAGCVLYWNAENIFDVLMKTYEIKRTKACRWDALVLKD